jgi:hypothetical protein
MKSIWKGLTLKAYVLCPFEGVVQGLEGTSDVWSRRVGVTSDPPSY